MHVVPGADAVAMFPAAPFHVELPPGTRFGPGLLDRLRAGLGSAAVGEATLADGTRIRIAAPGPCTARAAPAAGPPTTGPPWRSGSASGNPRVPCSRPCAGACRAHAVRSPAWRACARRRGRIRGAADALRFARWLAAGAHWWLAVRLGHDRSAVRIRPVRVAERPRRLAELAARRARGGQRADLAAAARLLGAAVGVHTGFPAEARRLALLLRAMPAATRAQRRGVRRLVDLADTGPRRTAAGRSPPRCRGRGGRGAGDGAQLGAGA